MQTASKHSSRRRPIPLIDFSAMSALGLMLVNFFILQQIWEKPQVMPLVMDDNEFHGCGEAVKEVKVLTLLCSRGKVYVYAGITDAILDSVAYSSVGLRRLILSQKQKVKDRIGLEAYTERITGLERHGSFLQVNIKPLASASYGNIVDVLDEMNICGVRYYTLLEPWPEEITFIQRPADGLYYLPQRSF